MSDPVFYTLAALRAWIAKSRHKQMLRFCRGRDRSARSIGNKVRRVERAHNHLNGNQTGASS